MTSLAATRTEMPINILLVEDDDGDAKAVVRAFGKAAIANNIHRVVDGVAALEFLRDEEVMKSLSPLIVLVDINMPRMSGHEMVSQIREDADLHQHVIFMLTTSKSNDDRATAYNNNVAGYIVKEKAGQDFLNLVNTLDAYWRLVELPVLR
ncbi:MAG: response regulator [Granulosicoccus sp.]|nr:response regulator [Granulosicoccus sp.]